MLDEKFWLAICFVTFVFLSYKSIKKAIIGYIDGKIALIQDELKQASDLKLEAEDALQNLQIKLDNITKEREMLLESAKKQIADMQSKHLQDLNIIIARKERESEKQIEELKMTALYELRNNFIQTAHHLIEEYIKKHKAELPSDVLLASRLLSSSGTSSKTITEQ